MLPDDVLLVIFDFCEDELQLSKKLLSAWKSLVQVCRRWRSLVFGSPRRLNLRLVVTTKRFADTLDVWPPFPIVILALSIGDEDIGPIIAVLGHRDRVDEIHLWRTNVSKLKHFLAVMQEPFPELTFLRLQSYEDTLPVVPDSFLGGSAPRLQKLMLDRIPFPGLPKLLLSATHLDNVQLSRIPHSGYISPDAVVTALSTLTSLKSFRLEFQSPLSHPDLESRRLLPSTRTVLPVLTHFSFKGVCDYLDVFVARIGAPRLDVLSISFFNDIVFDASQFIQFISRTPTLKAPEKAHVFFEDRAARVNFSSQTSDHTVEISCRELDWQVSSLEQVCTSCLPTISTTEDLHIYPDPYSEPHWQDNIEDSLWLELLHPFIAVKNLYLSEEFAPLIVPALQELVGDRTIEVLPILKNLFLEELRPSGPVHEGIGKFIVARELSGLPITVFLRESSARRSIIDEVPLLYKHSTIIISSSQLTTLRVVVSSSLIWSD